MSYRLTIDNKRVEILAGIIKKIGINSILKLEEKDPQYLALKDIYNHVNDVGITCLLAICNALISYRLHGSGEEYWREFADFIKTTHIDLDPDKIVDVVIEFLYHSNINRFLCNQKASRLRRLKLSGRHRSIVHECCKLEPNLLKLNVIIADGVKADIHSKTIVFAVKMAYYSLRTSGKTIIPPIDISIPVDRRIALLSYTSGILEFEGIELKNPRFLELKLLSKPSIIREAWFRVAHLSNTPPLNIDSLLWVIARGIGSVPLHVLSGKAFNFMVKVLGIDRSPIIIELLREIFWKPLPRS